MTTNEITIPEAIGYMADYLAPDVPFILSGPPGIGKTDAAEQVAGRMNCQFVATHPITSEPTDYRGMPRVVADAAEWLPIGLLRKLTDPACEPTVCLIDDIGQCQDDVQAAVMHIMLARQVGDYPIAPTVSFVAATNGTEHGAGARSLLSPLVTRGVLLHCRPDTVAFARHVIHHNGCSPIVAAYAMSRPDCFASDYERDGSQICTPRGLHKLGRMMARNAGKTLPQPVLAGAIGAERGVDLSLFILDWDANARLCEDATRVENAIRSSQHGIMSTVVTMAAYKTVAGEDMSNVTRLLKGDWRDNYEMLIAA